MECNKDEAVRAKQLAESKMQSGDFVGALKFAMKAQKLFPDIDNIAQILTVCEVHCASQNKLCVSEMDWYRILQTERFADEATIKKQYRKLALLLHPDKNKFAGAEAAFKLIGEANRVLSDQLKRSLYDMKCRASTSAGAPKPPFHHSKGDSFAKNHDGNAKDYQNNFHSQSTSWTWNSHDQAEQQTFWTSCQHCNTMYQFYKTIVNATLCCRQCSRFFTAHDLGCQGVPPGYTSTIFNNPKEAPNQGPSKAASESNGGGDRDKFVRSNPISMKKSTARARNNCKGEKSKDGYVAAGWAKGDVGMAKPSAHKSSELQNSAVGIKRARQSVPDFRESCRNGNDNDKKDVNVQENGVDPSGFNAGVNSSRSSKQKQQVSYKETSRDNFESCSKRPRQNGSSNTIEVEKEAPVTGRLSSNKYSPSPCSVVGGRNGEVKSKASGTPRETSLKKKSKSEQSYVYKEEASKSDLDDRKSTGDSCSPLNSNVPSDQEIIDCPDPDFSDFEKDKAENFFAVNQFWAIYDPIDGMPRFYARVKKVSPGFKLLVTWLEASPDNQDEIDWDDGGLPVACGKFVLGKSQEIRDRVMLSHQMYSIKGSGRGSYLVYPRKGETWAIFRDWNIGWSSNPEKHLKYEFEYVEVLSDFAENVGIEVAYLGKVRGFVSIFQRTEQNGISLFCIPPNELYRFSHRIPSFKMTGDERDGVPRGSFELDPAGLPINLFRVGDVKMEDGILNTGVKISCHESSEHKVEQVMATKSIHKAKVHESNDAERVSLILRRSPRRSKGECVYNGPVNTGQHMTREDKSKDIGHRNFSQPDGTTAACRADERVKTPKRHEKNSCEREIFKVRRSPRNLSKNK